MRRDLRAHSRNYTDMLLGESFSVKSVCKEKGVSCSPLPPIVRKGLWGGVNPKVHLINPIVKRIRDAIRHPKRSERLHSRINSSELPILSHSTSREESFAEGLKNMHHAVKLERRPFCHPLYPRHKAKARSTFHIEIHLKSVNTERRIQHWIDLGEKDTVSKGVTVCMD